ncbi:MAG TPA: twin-arginine translocase TatA/TatE family subunit [Spongiibacteraceae bacterium]|jgi:sec-independent protein translocase protein TatA
MGGRIGELLIILAIVFLLFGTKRLKDFGGDLGAAIKGFKKSVADEPPKPIEQHNPQHSVIEGEAEPVQQTNQQNKS